MKLTTRLSIFVSVLITVISIIASAQSIVVNRDEKLNTYKNLLNSLSSQLSATKEDEVSYALFFAENSPIPMSLVFVTNDQQVSYLSENAGSELILPNVKEFKAGLKKPIQKRDYLIRYYQINKNEYLAFYLSTANLNKELNQSLKPILIFDLLLIFAGALLVLLIFRRDSKLNSAAKGMQEFIGDASHELKTPLTVIRGYSEMLIKNPVDSAKYAERINEESVKMSNLIDKLLKIASLNEGEKSESIKIDLNEYLSKKIDDLKVLQPMRSVIFNSAPLEINAPYDLVDILFSNIISNARIHTPEDAPIRVSISGKHVTIEDGGPGLVSIPEKPFQRFDSSRSRETGGSGLGMSLIQKSAKEIDAKLVFGKSELGGLKVEITF